MALDPRISLGYQPPQFQQRDVAQEQGQLMQLQNAMLQGQQLRREVAQEEGIANYLARNNLSTPEGRAGLRQFGKTGLAYEKLLSEQEANALKRQETEGKVREQRMKALGTGLMMVKDNPTDDNLAAAFNGLDATGVDTKPFRQQFANITDINQRKQLVNSYVLSDPDARASLQFVQPKPEKYVIGGKTVTKDMNPASPTYKQVISEDLHTMTPDALAADARARQQLEFQQQKFNWEKANPGMEIKEGPNGEMLAVNKRTGAAQPVTMGGVAVAGAGKPLTESQAKAANFAGRMGSAFDVIDKLESNPSVMQKLLAGNSWTNILAPEAAQQYRQAQENWVTANLRKESGAVIGAEEMDREIKKYFPLPGEKPKTIEQKRQARLDAMAGMEAEASESGLKAVRKSRQALGERYQRKPADGGVDTSNPLLK